MAPGRVIARALPGDVGDSSMSEGDEALPFSASGESGDTSPSEISFSEAAIIPNGVETPSSNQSYGNGSKANASMPIAVIGIAVRAGSASTPDEFFEMLSRGRSSWVPDIPQERFNNASFYHPNPGKPGCINTNGACFIKQDVTKFDAPFFSMTELEATSLDPQQRLLLECAFEALENAGVQKHNTIGKDVGVFIGAGSPEYEYNLFRDSETMPMFQATGNHLAMQSNRISHFFDWRGPSVTMDTACSSSLTAVHYACQSIRNGESNIAMVGGCNLNLIPEFFINYSTSRLLGNDGRSFSFDERGTGYGRGEGCGMILLKPLDQAMKDNDNIRAVIAATGVNQDGHTPGITMPNGESQEALIRAVYQKAGLDPSQTGYIEAHGTGTRVGDPIEVTALHNVFNEKRTPRNPLYLGSVKSNIGHLESASGILAVIKTAVMLDRGFVLPNYDFKTGNPKIPLAEWGMKVPTRQLPWPRGKRFASINNFGFGGTNAHVVMERAPVQTNANTSTIPVKEDPPKRLFVLSAADKAACQTLLTNLVVYLEQRPEMFQRDLMSNVAYTLGQRRSLLPWRVAVPATESFQLIETISKGAIQPVKEIGKPRIGFVCTGQGAQWWAMGRELYDRYPVFQRTIDKASAVLADLDAPYNLVEELSLDENTTRVNQAHISQPACTAIQLALIELLKDWGIVPDAVVGHSSGEIAAAYAAGILSLNVAMTIAYHRGRLVPVLKSRFPDLQGTMLAVGCGKAEIDPLLQQLNHKVAKIACYNSPQSLTISGDTPAVVELSQVLEEKQIFNRRLVIETAYHSHHMELIAGDYLTSIQHLSAPGKASARFFSSLSGKEACYSELDASYWVRNLTSPVKFAQACANLVAPSGEFATGVDMIVEIGPHAALQGPVKQILKSAGGAIEKIPYAGTLARKKDAVDTIFDLASTVFCKGCPLDLGKVNFPKKVKTPSLLVDLPRYPWNHSRAYWHESRIAKVHKQRKEPRHDLLGALANYSNDLEPTWRNILRLDDVPWLRQHRIQDLTIFPIAAFVAMVLEAAAQLARSKDIEVDNFVLQDVDVHAPLMVPDDSVEVTVTLRSGSGEHRLNQTCRNFLIHSYSENKGWTLNCTGRVAVKATSLNEVGELMQSEKETAPTVRETAEFSDALPELAQTTVYEALEGLGVVYGPAFQGLHLCRADDRRAMADIIVNETAADMPEHFETNHIVHPSLLEQLVQMYWPLLGAGRAPLDVACLPNSIGRLTVSAKVVEHARNPGQKLRSFSKTEKPLSTDKPSTVSMYALAEGKPMIAIEDLTIAPLPAMESGEETPPPRELCYKQIWEPILTPLQGHGDTKVDSPQTEVADNSSTLPATTPITVVHETSPEQVKFAHTVSALLGRHGLLDVQLGVLEDIDPLDRNIICVTELHQSLLSTLTAPQFQKLQTITQSSQSLLWVTRGAYGQTGDPTANMVSGFSRAIRSENMFKFATLDLDAEHRWDDADAVKAILKVFRTVAAANSVVNTEMEFQERKGEFWTPRIVNDDTVNAYVHRRTFPPTTEESEFGADDRALKMSMSKPGLLESFYFIDDEVRDQPLPADQIEIRVGATVVGVRDVEAALGHVDTEDFGNSCSGVVTRVGSEVKRFAVGDRVAAFTQGGSFATYARATEDFALKLQGDISLENAASLPSAYCSAYHALVDLARLEDEDNVLILNAGGCVGQAAIILAQSIGTTVFATVETVADKKLLQRLKVPEEHIFYTNSDPLSKSVMSQTGPKGINVIFSIQADESGCQAALRCLSDFGRFVRDNTKGHSKTGLSCSTGNAAFYSFDLYTLAKSKPRVLGRMMREISRSLKHRILRPVEPSRILSLSDVSQAYKLTRSDPSCGTIVVVPHPEDVVRKTPSTKVVELFKSDATYVLIGGTGGLGRGMTRWMASKGARHIVLLSRRGAVTGPVKRLVDDLTPLGVNIFVHSCDVVKREDVDRLLQSDLVGLPPIKGVIHGAMTLRDKLFDKMNPTDWTEVIESKVQGAWNFHNALVESCTKLDFFIVYSSSAAAMGGRGQTAYAAANSFLDAFAQHRRSLGLPGASLGPTAVTDAGFLFENSDMFDSVKRNIGNNYITEAEVLSLLEATLDGTAEGSCNNHIITGVHLDPLNMPFWSTDAKYKHLRLTAEAVAALQNGGQDGKSKASWNSALKAAGTLEEAENTVCDGLVEKIAKTLGLEVDELDAGRNLSNYALDSLNAIDVRNWITREFECTMQVLELLASGTIRTLAKAVCAKSKLLKFT